MHPDAGHRGQRVLPRLTVLRDGETGWTVRQAGLGSGGYGRSGPHSNQMVLPVGSGSTPHLVGLVMRTQLPAWFQQVAELEARATKMLTFHTHLVHGLLQTRAYARAVLGSLDATDLDDHTAVRLARQRVFEKSEPPVFWAVMSEAVLRQEIGSREIMRGQLAHLLTFASNPRINVQVLPFSAGAHAGMQGSFNLYRFARDPDIVYTEGYGCGHPTANPDTVTDCSLRYDHLQAAALSLKDSAELIRRVMEERYEEQRDSGGHPMA